MTPAAIWVIKILFFSLIGKSKSPKRTIKIIFVNTKRQGEKSTNMVTPVLSNHHPENSHMFIIIIGIIILLDRPKHP